MVVSIFGIGAVVGGLLSSMLADKAGRRGGLFYTNIIAFFAAALMGLAKTLDVYPMMLFGRFFIGINVGLAVMVPMYLTEIAPTNLRGTFGSFHQLFITFSILVSQVFGLPQFFGTADRWPYIFVFVAVPALLQVIALPMIPESPKFTLCIRGEVERAIQDLELLRGTGNAWLEVQQMREEAIRTTNDIPSMLDMFRGSLLWPSTLTVVMMIAQQLTGNWYLLVGDIVVDHPRFGRRVLLVVGVVGMMISSIFLVVFISLSKTGVVWASYFAAVSVVLFVMFFAAGPGSIPWFFPSEIVFTNARANACALTAVANWVTNFFVSSTFVIVHVS
uniref:MFS domain-containing protein n=1 Tax=Angiostrongylus cantonensis TaxID=6313 RepID=A0A0K0DIP9_ANGCA